MLLLTKKISENLVGKNHEKKLVKLYFFLVTAVTVVTQRHNAIY